MFLASSCSKYFILLQMYERAKMKYMLLTFIAAFIVFYVDVQTVLEKILNTKTVCKQVCM